VVILQSCHIQEQGIKKKLFFAVLRIQRGKGIGKAKIRGGFSLGIEGRVASFPVSFRAIGTWGTRACPSVNPLDDLSKNKALFPGTPEIRPDQLLQNIRPRSPW